jgi:hypothetical protein
MWRDREQRLNCVFSCDGRVEDEIENDDRIWGKSS